MADSQRATDEGTLAEWDRLVKNGHATYRQIGEQVGLTGEAVRKRLRTWRRQNSSPTLPDTGDPFTVLDLKHPPTESDLLNLLEQVGAMQGVLGNLDTRQEVATIQLDTSEPAVVAFSGDWHVGGEGTDHTALQRHLKLVRETPDCYTVLMGDYCDNFLSRGTPPATAEQVIPSGPQIRLAAHFFAYIAPKVLAFVEGNHDNWTWKLANLSYVQAAAERLQKPYLRHGGILNLRVGQVQYRIAVRHDYKFKSALNTTNSQRQFHYFTGGADIVALGHLHYGEVQHKELAGAETVWLRNGSFKVFDDYAHQIGVGHGQPVMPAVVLYPDRRKLLPFRNLEDAVEFVQGR